MTRPPAVRWVPDGELVVELVVGACLLHVRVEAHEGRGQELLADGVGHDPTNVCILTNDPKIIFPVGHD